MFSDACGDIRQDRLVRTNRKDTVAQIANKVNSSYDKNMSEHTVSRLDCRRQNGHAGQCPLLLHHVVGWCVRCLPVNEI